MLDIIFYSLHVYSDLHLCVVILLFCASPVCDYDFVLLLKCLYSVYSGSACASLACSTLVTITDVSFARAHLSPYIFSEDTFKTFTITEIFARLHPLMFILTHSLSKIYSSLLESHSRARQTDAFSQKTRLKPFTITEIFARLHPLMFILSHILSKIYSSFLHRTHAHVKPMHFLR